MDHSRVAQTVLTAVGGAGNITAAAHCATRLRMVLADSSKVDQETLDNDPDIKGTFQASGMFQVIVGPGDVDVVYDKMIASGVQEVSKDQAKQVAAEKQNVFLRFIKTIADIFVPMLPALIAGGLMMSLNNVLTAEGLIGEGSIVGRAPWLADYASMIQLIAAAAFASLPVLIGFSAAKRFGGNEYLGAAIGAAMVSSDLVNAYAQVAAIEGGTMQFWHVFGLEVAQVGYQGQVIPVLAIAWILSVVEKRFHKWLSGTADFLLTPLFTMLITGFIAFVVVGPIMRVVAAGISDGLLWLYTTGGVFGGLILGLVYSPIVITGLHQSFPAIELPMIANIAETGGSFLLPIAAMANVAQGAACLAVFIKVRDAKLKALSGASAASAFFGITEPAIFGVNMRLRWPFFCGLIGSAVGCALIALFDVRSQSLGSAGIVGFVSVVPKHIPMFFVCLLVTIVVTFAVTLAYASSRGKESLSGAKTVAVTPPPAPAQEPIVAAPAPATASAGGTATAVAARPAAPALLPGTVTTVVSPMRGRILPLGEVPDAGFASGAIGKGVGIDPTEGRVVAPADGVVAMTFPTGHAIGLKLDNGIEMLVHIGIDTVNMEGKGFTVHVGKGDRITAGTPLVSFDRSAIEAAGYSPVTPVLVTNHRKFASVEQAATGETAFEATLLKVTAKDA
ncbi:sucrose-specific PTS transporter subunit IIBC [Tessaracoccus caeni]|uniref:sucrose-specific PTS transporter subunit IIBC n=1 Tax=Tessaracoccus caeni TaxID=3031239 RepID=UPI0023DC47C9|nr:sucrose-specific PTS transporter subunit IIBC [Tessaracoccus caeni]MDF1489969.1 sucrose-specific PTS transporter subunit IIBC [Tessaracoccus caeni]